MMSAIDHYNSECSFINNQLLPPGHCTAPGSPRLRFLVLGEARLKCGGACAHARTEKAARADRICRDFSRRDHALTKRAVAQVR
jgi:hypothetical protein